MAGPFGWLTGKVRAVVGAPEMAKRLYGDVRDAVDALHTSDEERHEMEREAKLDFINARIRWLDATMTQNPTRATLARRITTFWLGAVTVRVLAAVSQAFVDSPQMEEAVVALSDAVGVFTEPVGTILMFYFVVGGAGNAVRNVIVAQKSGRR